MLASFFEEGPPEEDGTDGNVTETAKRSDGDNANGDNDDNDDDDDPFASLFSFGGGSSSSSYDDDKGVSGASSIPNRPQLNLSPSELLSSLPDLLHPFRCVVRLH